MRDIPLLWSAAYGSRRWWPVRFGARLALRGAGFVRMLATADHQGFIRL